MRSLLLAGLVLATFNVTMGGDPDAAAESAAESADVPNVSSAVPATPSETPAVEPDSAIAPVQPAPLARHCEQGGCVLDCDECGCDGGLFGDPGVEVRGWVNAGFIGNTNSPNSKFNGPYNAVDRANEAMLNQLYLIGEVGLPECGTGVGGRIDFLYGEDHFLAESVGLEKRPNGTARWNDEFYGVAFPQAYVSVGSRDLNLQVGHFYSVVGYEGLMAPDNFFYSKSYSYQFAGPFTHWGGQVNWRANDEVTVQAGIHNGWDALDRTTDRVGFIGKVRYDDRCSGGWASFAITTGDEFNDSAALGLAPAFTNRTRYSALVGVPVSDDIEYVFHHWLGVQENGSVGGGEGNWYGIDQYVYYTIDDCWKAGLRFEWFRDEDGTRVGLNRASSPNVPPFAGDFYSLTAGVNWRPIQNFVLRPEVRMDWYDGNAVRQPYEDGTEDKLFTIGFDGIYSF